MRKFFLMGCAALTALSLTYSSQAGQAPAPTPRINRVLDLLEAGKPVFSTWVNYAGVGSDYQSAVSAQRSVFDFLIYDLEHNPLDITQLRDFLQNLLDPATLAREGIAGTKPVIVRVPPNGREMNEFVIKNILDMGVMGLMLPHIETPEQALHAVQAARYPQRVGAADMKPEGMRGSSPAVAARYWGMSGQEYGDRSDVWGLDPSANLLLLFIIENKMGVDNVRAIAKVLKDNNVKAILWAGTGDMSVSYGRDAAAVERGVQAVLAAGKEFGLPVGINNTEDFKLRYEQGFRVWFNSGPAYFANGPIPADVRKSVGR